MESPDDGADMYSPDDPRAVYAFLPVSELKQQCKGAIHTNMRTFGGVSVGSV